MFGRVPAEGFDLGISKKMSIPAIHVVVIDVVRGEGSGALGRRVGFPLAASVTSFSWISPAIRRFSYIKRLQTD